MSSPLFDRSFLDAFLAHPLQVASPLPSGPALARAVAAEVDPAQSGLVLELGPGSGAVTAALLERGVAPDRLRTIEYDGDFCALLRGRFPGVAILQGDAFRFREHVTESLSAIVSGLPVVGLDADRRRAFLIDGLDVLPASAPFIQFSYSLTPPLPPGPGIQASRRTVWANLPPMQVWRYTRPAH